MCILHGELLLLGLLRASGFHCTLLTCSNAPFFAEIGAVLVVAQGGYACCLFESCIERCHGLGGIGYAEEETDWLL